jgi:D-alanyl-D-alanine carboxypeptidase
VTKSANDAATALGEFLGGSEEKFAQMATAKARQLGMGSTTFRNAHGLPNSRQVTTARDMARLGIALREHFPHHYSIFQTRSFTYGKQTFGNHNRLLGTVRGVDGIKTGFINASGFNLVTSVSDNGRLIVGVVMGGRTGASRNAQMQKLVAENLPKASRGGGGNLIARSGPSPLLAANGGFSLPERGPVPTLRDPVEVRLATAYAPTTAVEALAAFPVPDSRPVVGRAALAETLRAQQTAAASVPPVGLPSAPLPPAPVQQAAVQHAALAPQAVDSVTTASTATDASSMPSGWVVQVAAMPEESAAMAFLNEAQGRTGGAIAAARPFTVAFVNGGARLYRARFGGFAGKDQAWAACEALKKKGYGCWATEQ